MKKKGEDIASWHEVLEALDSFCGLFPFRIMHKMINNTNTSALFLILVSLKAHSQIQREVKFRKQYDKRLLSIQFKDVFLVFNDFIDSVKEIESPLFFAVCICAESGVREIQLKSKSRTIRRRREQSRSQQFFFFYIFFIFFFFYLSK